MASGYYIVNKAISELIIGIAAFSPDGAGQHEVDGAYESLSEIADVGKFTFINTKIRIIGEVSLSIPISIYRDANSVTIGCVFADGQTISRISIEAEASHPDTFYVFKQTDRY